MVSCFRTALTCCQPTHRVVLCRAGSKKTSYCTLQKLTQTGKTNGWYVRRKMLYKWIQMMGFSKSQCLLEWVQFTNGLPGFQNSSWGRGVNPGPPFWFGRRLEDDMPQKNGVGTCWNPHWVSCWTLCSPRNNLEDLQESDAKAPPVPRCMLADDKKKERKKKNSFIMKKCRDAFQNEEKCLEQAVHGNCKWCEGLCGPSEVWGALTWHSSEHVPRGSGLQCVETKNTPNWFTQEWVNMMKYDEICISNFIVYLSSLYHHGHLHPWSSHAYRLPFSGACDPQLSGTLRTRPTCAEKEGRGRIDGAMIGDFLETPWLINIWRYHLVLIGVGSFLPDMLSMNQLGAHMEWINQGLWIQWKRYPFERRILLKTTTQIDQKCFA